MSGVAGRSTGVRADIPGSVRAAGQVGAACGRGSGELAQRAREVDCAAYLFVNGQLHQEDLERLADGIQRDGGQPVGIETWASTAQPAPLRPAIDRLLARVRSAQDERTRTSPTVTARRPGGTATLRPHLGQMSGGSSSARSPVTR